MHKLSSSAVFLIQYTLTKPTKVVFKAHFSSSEKISQKLQNKFKPSLVGVCIERDIICSNGSGDQRHTKKRKKHVEKFSHTLFNLHCCSMTGNCKLPVE